MSPLYWRRPSLQPHQTRGANPKKLRRPGPREKVAFRTPTGGFLHKQSPKTVFQNPEVYSLVSRFWIGIHVLVPSSSLFCLCPILAWPDEWIRRSAACSWCAYVGGLSKLDSVCLLSCTLQVGSGETRPMGKCVCLIRIPSP